MNNILKLIILVMSFSQIGCALNTARTNARIDGSMHGGVALGAASTAGGIEENGVQTKNRATPLIQLDVGSGSKAEEGFGFDVNLKAGLPTLAAVDLYVEAPHLGNFYYGFGADVGFQNDLYLVGSYYMNPKTFVTLVGRVGYDLTEMTNDDFFYNSQMAFGFANDDIVDELNVFAGYTYFAGNGIDMNFFDFEGSDPTQIAHHFIYAGLGLEF